MNTVKNTVQAPRPEVGAGGLRVGRLTKPHGLKGGLKLELYTDNPDLRFVPGAKFYLQVPQESPWFGALITLKQLHWFNRAPVAFFEEITNRTQAESITRAILWIDEAAVNDGAEDNAWYDSQLTGLKVLAVDDGVLGVIESVEHLPSQDLLAVKTESAEIVLVPLVAEIVPEVDIERGYVRVTPPEGLFPSPETEAV